MDGIWEMPFWGLWGSSPSLLCHSLVIHIQLFVLVLPRFSSNFHCNIFKSQKLHSSFWQSWSWTCPAEEGPSKFPHFHGPKNKKIKNKLFLWSYLGEENVELLLHLLWFPLGVFCSFPLCCSSQHFPSLRSSTQRHFWGQNLGTPQLLPAPKSPHLHSRRISRGIFIHFIQVLPWPSESNRLEHP